MAAAYPFLQDGTVVDAGGYEIYAIVPGLDCRISIYPAQITEEGEYLEDLNDPWYIGQENEVIILRCNMSEIISNCNGFCAEAEYECAIPSYGIAKGWTSCSGSLLL